MIFSSTKILLLFKYLLKHFYRGSAIFWFCWS